MLRKTADGSLTLYNDKYNQLYSSEEGAFLEANSLYIKGSGFEAYCQKKHETSSKRVKICDVGLGLGYNAVSSLSAWFKGGGTFELEVLSLENDYELFGLLREAKGSWQEGWDSALLSYSKGFEELEEGVWQKTLIHPSSGKTAKWLVYLGDARDTLKKYKDSFQDLDYIWQDAFSPLECPELWDDSWFGALSDLSHSGTCLMTYSVAKSVRDVLDNCGWDLEKIETPTKKRSWLKAIKKE